MTNTNALTTNRALVVSVDANGCVVAVNGQNHKLTWAQLEDAATQDEIMNYGNRGYSCDDTTRALAEFYRQIRHQAREMVHENKALPIRCEVRQDSSNVWWVAAFVDAAGQSSWIPRAADEGGTLSHAWMAENEAKYRADRLRKRGYTVIVDTVRRVW